MKHKREVFLQEEGSLFLTWYRKMEDAVEDVAKSQGVRLVLRTSEDAMTEGNRESILKEINRPVVWQDRVDITDEVLQRLNAM